MEKIGNKSTEKYMVEDNIIQRLEEKGWKFVPADALLRDSYSDVLLVPNLIKAIRKVNSNIELTQEDIDKVLNKLRFSGFDVEGARKVLDFFKFGIPIKVEKERVVRYIQLFDYDNISNNEFIVTRQVYFNGKEVIRPDVVLYINGIPIVNIECKNPINKSVSWQDAYRQIKWYEKVVPELYKYIQIGVVVDVVVKYFPILPWQEDVLVGEWKFAGHVGEYPHISYSIFDTFLSPGHLLNILKYFTFYREIAGETVKVLPRYMQYRAVNKIVDRVLKRVRGEDDRNKGLIWHWQGSGKTLTMIFSAVKLYYSKEMETPTIFLVVDRTELESQLYEDFNALDVHIKPEVIDSIAKLKEVLSADGYRGRRGIFVVLVHKFRPEEMRDLSKVIESFSSDKETIMNRKNVVVFVDEGHRTQYGSLASQMRDVLKEASFFAFTGTPVSANGRDTYLAFAYPPDELYLDKYFIDDSLRDGFTVRIVYQPRLAELHLNKALLEEFFDSKLDEIPISERYSVDKRIGRIIDPVRLFFENYERIKKIAKDIASHFKENVDGKFKAMVVTASRKACELYKKALGKFLPSDYFEIVMSYEQNESEFEFLAKERIAKYGTKDSSIVKKMVVEQFKEEDKPKILIVTDMLLTGFDAPMLQVMYLDKPLKGHKLLQAIARVNRPYKGIKQVGIVIDYAGILTEVKRALSIYQEEDVKHVLNSVDIIESEFVDTLEALLRIFDGMERDIRRDVILKAFELVTSDRNLEEDFVSQYKHLRNLFELLGAHSVKVRRLCDYKWLSAIYVYYVKMTRQQRELDSDLLQKYYKNTLEVVRESIEVERIIADLPGISLDEEFWEKIKNTLSNKEEKAANVLFALNKMVLVDKDRGVVSDSLIDRVERLLELWREKIKDYEKIYDEGVSIFNEINRLDVRKKSLGLSDFEYAVLLLLEENLGRDADFVKIVRDLSGQLRGIAYPGWLGNPALMKQAEQVVRKFVRKFKREFSLTIDQLDELYKLILNKLKIYGDKL